MFISSQWFSNILLYVLYNFSFTLSGACLINSPVVISSPDALLFFSFLTAFSASSLLIGTFSGLYFPSKVFILSFSFFQKFFTTLYLSLLFIIVSPLSLWTIILFSVAGFFICFTSLNMAVDWLSFWMVFAISLISLSLFFLISFF